MAPLCKFYQQGNCRYGASCRFEHPGANSNANPFGTNRFSALSNTSNKPQDASNPFKVTKEGIKVDLEERPTWILSSYGPGKDAPEQLFGGYPREQSLEEVMLYIRGSANPQQALAEITGLYNQSEQQIQTILGNLDGAVQFIIASENNHPNRNDICKQNTMEGGTNGIFAVRTGFAENPLVANTLANQNPFSATTQANPFGGGTPAFGQPSTLGQKPSAFGQPSQMGAGAPASGQPSQMGATAPAFGQPSQIGAAAPAFGQPSVLGQKPNPFAAAAASPSPFSQASQPAFGQPSNIGQPANPFGAPSSISTPANPFGQQTSAPAPSPFAQAAQTANQTTASPFSQPAAAANPFARPQAQMSSSNDLSMDTSAPEPAANPFGQQPSTSVGMGAQANNPFGAAQSSGFSTTMNTNANPFGKPATTQIQTQPAQTANSGAKAGPYAPGSTKTHPPPESYITKTMHGQMTSFNGLPVVYKWKVNNSNNKLQDEMPPNATTDQIVPGVRKPDGVWAKILFPAGPPAYNKDTEPNPPELYTDDVRAAYARMQATGRFEGDVPEVPPMREDCVWNF